MKTYLCGAGLLCIIAAMNPASLYADSLQVTCSMSAFTVSNVSPAATAALTCPKFNPSLGKLTDYWFLTGGPVIASSSLTIQNNTGGTLPNQFLFAFTLLGSTTLPGGVPLSGVGMAVGFPAPLGLAPSGTLTLMGTNEGLTTFMSPQTVSLSSYLGDDSLVEPFAFVSTDITANNDDPGITLVNYSASVLSPSQLRLTYDYTPVPEPFSAGLFGVSAIMLLGWRSRRGRSSFLLAGEAGSLRKVR